MLAAFTLRVRRKWPAAIRSLGPRNSEPVQVLDHRVDEFRTASLPIEIFISQNECSSALGGALGGNPKRARVANVEKAGRRGGETPAIWI